MISYYLLIIMVDRSLSIEYNKLITNTSDHKYVIFVEKLMQKPYSSCKNFVNNFLQLTLVLSDFLQNNVKLILFIK